MENTTTKQLHTQTEADPYAQMKQNTVSAENQLRPSENVIIDNPDGCGVRVMFVGNSMTLHGILPSIGWHTFCGMAASAKEKDYVHVLHKAIREKTDDPAFCICQIADWELKFKQGEDVFPKFSHARDFAADIIVMRFVENCPTDALDPNGFYAALDKLLTYLNPTGKAKFVMTTGFWRHPYDETIAAYAKDHAYPLAELGDLGEDDRMKAIGLFDHPGVAAHPGDLGMEKMAERIMEHLEPLLP